MRKSIVISCALVLFGTSMVAWAQEGIEEQNGAQIEEEVVLEEQVGKLSHPKGLLPGTAIEKLSKDQIYDLYRQANSKNRYDLTGILVPTFIFLFLTLIILIIMAFRGKNNREFQQTLRIMVEKGVEIPRELLVREIPKNQDLRRGILVLATGVGYCLFIALVGVWEPDALNGLGVGLIPIFIGLGYLIVWKYTKKDQRTM